MAKHLYIALDDTQSSAWLFRLGKLCIVWWTANQALYLSYGQSRVVII